MRLSELLSIADASALDDLSEVQIKELQRALSCLGYPIGVIDGDLGLRTRTAWAEFKTDVHQGSPDRIGPGSVRTLQQQVDQIGSSRITDPADKRQTIHAIRAECGAQGIGLTTQVAYVLATAQWETAHTFKPVKEAFWKSEEWRREHLRYFPYYGRGYVQLTWRSHYQTYGDILGMDLVRDPDLALDPNVALFVLVHGFKTGSFTGRKITDFITATLTDFVKARRCINGMDKAQEIAALAEKHLSDLGDA
jgi:peptidoglycan hydrolase-like protein with peptidoglycan-binding domain